MANGRKSVLSKDTIHLKQTYQSVFESVMIWVLFGGREGRMYKTKAKICCKLYELELNPFKNWIKFFRLCLLKGITPLDSYTVSVFLNFHHHWYTIFYENLH